jgi:hypothetical protein
MMSLYGIKLESNGTTRKNDCLLLSRGYGGDFLGRNHSRSRAGWGCEGGGDRGELRRVGWLVGVEERSRRGSLSSNTPFLRNRVEAVVVLVTSHVALWSGFAEVVDVGHYTEGVVLDGDDLVGHLMSRKNSAASHKVLFLIRDHVVADFDASSNWQWVAKLLPPLRMKSANHVVMMIDGEDLVLLKVVWVRCWKMGEHSGTNGWQWTKDCLVHGW